MARQIERNRAPTRSRERVQRPAVAPRRGAKRLSVHQQHGRRAGDHRVQVQLTSDDHAAPITKEEVTRLYAERYRGADAYALLEAMIRDDFPGGVALVSSFGAEAGVLLHLVAEIDSKTPVIFLDTGKLFGETLRYRDTLVGELGLEDVRTSAPDPARVDSVDPDGVLW